MCFACHCLGEHRFTRSRRTHQQRAFRNSAAQMAIFFGMLQEVNYFCHLPLGFFHACHVGKLDGAHFHTLVFQALTHIHNGLLEVGEFHGFFVCHCGSEGGIVAHL